MTFTRTITIALLALVLASASAAAQAGPDPGYGSGLDYAAAYASAQADNATTDPAAYAAGKANADNATLEVAHGAYMACWIADDNGVPDATGICANYYTPPGDVQPLNEDDGADAEEAVDNVTADFNATVAEIADAVNDTAADPASAPTQIERIVDAVGGFAQRTAATLLGLITGLAGGFVDGLVALAGLGSLGLTTAGSGLADLGGLLGDGAMATGNGLATGAATSWDGLTWIGDQMALGGKVIGGGVVDAAAAVADATAAAVRAVADTVSSVAQNVADAVRGWFGQAPASQTPEVGEAVGDVTEELGADDLLAPVRDLVP